MYSPLTGDLANARMGDRHRDMARVALESSVRRSRPSARRFRWSGESVTAIAAAVAGLRLALVRPRISPSAN
jgi:hypothetical protein